MELNEKRFKVLPVLIDELQDHHHRYICGTPCYRDLGNFFTLKENTETLRISILKRFEERQNKVQNAVCRLMHSHTSHRKQRDSLGKVNTAVAENTKVLILVFQSLMLLKVL